MIALSCCHAGRSPDGGIVPLHFVRLLCSGPEKDRFAVKGGCNLRFFFDSVRYSEDLDLDVVPAIRQKVLALVGRTAVQARDVFDLSVLFAKAGGAAEALQPVRARIEQAIERTLEVSYDAYKSQVVSYLKVEHIDSLGSPEAWDALQSQVIAMLEQALR